MREQDDSDWKYDCMVDDHLTDHVPELIERGVEFDGQKCPFRNCLMRLKESDK